MTGGGGEVKILVAEDTPTQAAMIKLGLQRFGHEVLLARDGIDAIEMAFRELPDLIVSDVVMPRLNGYQVCRLLKDDPQTSTIPVVLLTSLDQKQDMFWGLKSGADKYVTKGGDIPEFCEDVQAFLDEWYGGKSTSKGAERPAREIGDLRFDAMERVVRLLDRNLFESTVINEIRNLVNTLEDYRKTIVSVLEILSRVIDFHVGCLYLTGEENQEYHFLINKSVEQEFLPKLRGALHGALGLEESASGTPALEEVHDPRELLLQKGDHPADVASLSTSILYTQGRPSGIIGLASADGKTFTDRTEHTFEIITRQANIVIDYARLYEKTKKLSITDGLTKVYNHRYFQEQLRREFARSQRKETPLSLIMLDIDHFKHFNDTFGHQQGDIVLKELARLLQSEIRTCDLLARYGGEEFAIIMPEAEDKVCLVAAERLRKAVESHSIPGRDKEMKVTISMGVATVPREDIPGPPDLINAADRALYGAKESGRNRVQC
jgi:diguanylate cyclase (GGDEF)-like protein